MNAIWMILREAALMSLNGHRRPVLVTRLLANRRGAALAPLAGEA